MSYELVVNVTASETRVALVENKQLVELYLERHEKCGLVGNFYRGKVARVLPGMQAAFVDIGVGKAGFLHVADRPDQTENIAELVYQGQEILVQVIKDKMGEKGPRLTTDIRLPSRYFVFMPKGKQINISQRIQDEAERARLREIFREHQQTFGCIFRTAAAKVSVDILHQDINALQDTWHHINQKFLQTRAPALLYEDLGLIFRIIREYASEAIASITVDDQYIYEKLALFLQTNSLALMPRLKLFHHDVSLFERKGIEKQIQAALQPKVKLKSGSYLIFEQTEAMVTIDVNTGGFIGQRNLDETILSTNLEAAQAIAKQLRLRNLGGIIIIDFIDMKCQAHREQVLKTLILALACDRMKTCVYGFSELGFVQMTRKRTRESLMQILSAPCLVCHGSGMQKTPETVCYEILREMNRIHRAYETERMVIYASPVVVKLLLDNNMNVLLSVKTDLVKPIQVYEKPLYTIEQFDVVMV